MSILGVQINFTVPKVESFKRLYDYKIRAIYVDYSVNGGIDWYPFKEILSPSDSDFINFSTVETPVSLITYTLNEGTVVHPTLYDDSLFTLKFKFELFSTNSAFEEEGERVHVVELTNTYTYAVSYTHLTLPTIYSV